jgi:hypothetical protein
MGFNRPHIAGCAQLPIVCTYSQPGEESWEIQPENYWEPDA